MKHFKILAALGIALVCLFGCQSSASVASEEDLPECAQADPSAEEPLFTLIELPMEYVAKAPCDPQYIIRNYNYHPDIAEPWYDQAYTAEDLDDIIQRNHLELSSAELDIDFEHSYCFISYGRRIMHLVYTDIRFAGNRYPYILYENQEADSMAYLYTTPQLGLIPCSLDTPIVFTRVDGKYVEFRCEYMYPHTGR